MFTAASAVPDSRWSVRVWTGEGLTDRNIAGIVQASDGFLWLATARRLARFDGVRFEEFSLSNLVPVEDRRIRALTASRRGGLWLAVDGGRIVYIGPEGSRVFTDQVPTSRAESLVEDGEGAAWVSFVSGPICRIKDGVVETFGREAGMEEGKCFLATDRDGQLWFRDMTGEIGFFRNGRFERAAQRVPSSAQFAASSAGGLWVAVSSGLFTYSENGPLLRLEGPNALDFKAYPRAMLEDRTGALWIGTQLDGLYRYTKQDGLERIPTSYPEIMSLVEDREGNIWAGTAGGGLNRVSLRAVAIEGDATGFPHQSIQSICEDTSGRFWAATQNGALMTRTTGEWQNGPDEWPPGVACVAPDPKNGVWIGARIRPPSKRPPSNHILHRICDGKLDSWGPDEGLISHTVSVILPARDGTVWLAGEGPTSLQYLRNGKIDSLALPPGANRIQTMEEDAEGRVWIGFDLGGLFRIQDDTLVNEKPHGGPKESLRGLVALPDGTLWLGYKGGGLGRLKSGQFTHINKEHGLFSNSVSHLISDNQGWLWCGGDEGVFKVRLQALNDLAEGRASRVQSVHYGEGQGLPQLQVTAKVGGSAIRSLDGRIWMPMSTALFVADPARSRENLEPPSVLLTQVKADGGLVAHYLGLLPSLLKNPSENMYRLPGQTVLHLPPVRQKMEFLFTAPSFSAPENVHFRYQLDGYDDDWTEAGTQRIASYARLPAGSYQFRVQACSGDGVWNETGARLAFAIAPFYWQTWWFRLLVVLGFTGITVLIVRQVSHRKLQRKIQILRQQMSLEKERARIARDLHDDAGNRLTRVMLLSKLALREREQPAISAVHLEHISVAAREATDALDEIVWAVNPHNDTLPDLVSYLVRFATELCDAAGMTCIVDVQPQLPNRNLPTDVRHNLFLAAKEAINNAVRHAHATELRLSVTATQEAVTIVVADNGSGLPALSAEPGADGLRNLRERMEEVNGKFEIRSAPDTGTHLTFSYPWPATR
jgi:signal transduction histidine kinase/ligand-binding sensor domain-containing protein